MLVIWEDGRCQRSGLRTLHVPSLSYDIPRISHSIPYTYPAHLVHFIILQSLCIFKMLRFKMRRDTVYKKKSECINGVCDFTLILITCAP